MIYVEFHAYLIQLDQRKVSIGINNHISSIQALKVKTCLDKLGLVQFISRWSYYDQLKFKIIGLRRLT